MATASRTVMTVRCASCGHLGTHLNGPQCFHCGAVLPPPGTQMRARETVPVAAAVAARADIQRAPAAAPSPRPNAPHSSPAAPQPYQPRPYQPRPNPPLRAAYEGRGYTWPVAQGRPPYPAAQHAPATIPSWLLPLRIALFVIAALGYVVALRLATNDTSTSMALAAGFLTLALVASVGSLALRAYARLLRRRIARQSARSNTPYTVAPAPRMVVGSAPTAPANPYAGAALLYGGASLVITVGAGLLGYYWFGLLGLYALYFGIRGVAEGTRLQGYSGLAISLVGLAFSGLALVLTALLATGLLPVMVSF